MRAKIKCAVSVSFLFIIYSIQLAAQTEAGKDVSVLLMYPPQQAPEQMDTMKTEHNGTDLKDKAGGRGDASADNKFRRMLKTVERYLEEGIIKTGYYQVINTNSVESLLKAQELSLSGIFESEKNPVSVGSFIPADAVLTYEVIDAFSDKPVVSTRIIDISTGETLRSENKTLTFNENGKIEPIRLYEIAFALSGLEYLQIEDKGLYQLTVVTEPAGADVYLDGKKRGKSPCVLDGVPAGTYRLEVRKEALYAARSLRVTENKTERLRLNQRTGNILVKTKPENADVYIDGRFIGKTGLLEGVSATEHTVLLRKPKLFWKQTIPVLPNRTVEIDVQLKQTAELRVKAGFDSECVLKGNGENAHFIGEKQLDNLIPGDYLLQCTHPVKGSYNQTVTLSAGESRVVEPHYVLQEYSRQTLKVLKQELNTLTGKKVGISIYDAYLKEKVPDMKSWSASNGFVALVPLLNFSLLSEPPLLPEANRKHAKRNARINLALGTVLHTGLAAYIVAETVDAEPIIGTAGLITAGAAAVANSIYTVTNVLHWAKWTEKVQSKKEMYITLDKEIDSIRMQVEQYE